MEEQTNPTQGTDSSKDTNITTVSIPKALAEKIKKRCEGTGFNSVSSYVTYVLRQVLSKVEEQPAQQTQPGQTGQEAKPKEAFSQEDERKVKERLKSLGYLD